MARSLMRLDQSVRRAPPHRPASFALAIRAAIRRVWPGLVARFWMSAASLIRLSIVICVWQPQHPAAQRHAP